MKTKTKFEIALVGIVLVVIGYIVFFSGTPPVEAQRTVIVGGDLYRASDLFGSKRLTNSKDIKIMFEEKNGKMLVGKGLEGEQQSEGSYSTHLYLMNDDGSGEKIISDKLIDYALFDKTNENIIYYLTREGEIYQYNSLSDKSTFVVMEASRPDLSPDGKSLVYLKAPHGWKPGQYFEGTPGLVVFNLETKEERNLTKPQGEHASNDYAPVWTPDGKHIVFFNDGLYMINADGTGRTQLTQSGDGTNTYGISDDPLWSSDGHYFLYHSDYDIILVELDLPNKRVVTAGPIAYGVAPRWIEEGKTISVLSPNAKAGDLALSVIDLNGKVLSGDKSHEAEYYSSSKGAFRRVAPKPVAPPILESVREVPPEAFIDINAGQSSDIPKEITPESFQLINDTGFSDVPKEIPADAIKPVTE